MRESSVKAGQWYQWMGVDMEVIRVARDGSWADFRCYGRDETWNKRQTLPLPPSASRTIA